ncbi:MAG: lipid-A-disaccharide synthase [Alphaproteobacteria bacterium]|nr:lipid-A-disaccharide synthase [Alphaproteobacteria bacterium]
MKVKVYLIAGEPSGDLLASRVMRALKRQNKNICFYGLGGETMQAEGLKSLFNIQELTVMGLFEVLPKLPKILKRFKQIIQDIEKVKPDIIMTVDSYSFSARLHKLLTKRHCQIPHVHLVAPQVWAWKKGRAKTIHKFIDHLFCLLPTEEKYFKPYGMSTTFVGHPVIEGGADKGSAERFFKNYHLSKKKEIICMLPGSRHNEIAYLLPCFKEVAEQLYAENSNRIFVIPTVDTVKEKLAKQLAGWSVPHLLITGEKNRYDAFAAARVAFAASGTVSLELAMAGVPHLITYRMNPLTAALARRVLKIKYVNLLNLLVDKPIIPELLQENCTVEKLVETVHSLLSNKRQNVAPALKKLGLDAKHKTTPAERVASVLIKMARPK